MKFQSRFDVILGLNEKEAYEIAGVLGLDASPRDWKGLAELSVAIQQRVPVDTLVVHPVAYALAVSGGVASVVEGPVCKKPKITTGAGDHFNAGFATGAVMGLDAEGCLALGVSTSGHYVRTGESPTLAQLETFLANWR